MFSPIRTVLLVFLVIWSPLVSGELLQARALNFPDVGADDGCPVSIGRHDVVPHDAKNIFCAACAWHGSGPVYVSFAWTHAEQTEARFVLSDVKNVAAGVYTVKTPLVADPDYEGPILIRGQRLNVGNEDYTLFPGAQTDKVQKLQANPTGPLMWSFWGWGMKLSSPGCYGLQIDTIDSTNVVVFEAK